MNNLEWGMASILSSLVIFRLFKDVDITIFHLGVAKETGVAPNAEKDVEVSAGRELWRN